MTKVGTITWAQCREIAETPALARETTTNLESWARKLRDQVGAA